MQFVVLACLVVVTVAAPQFQQDLSRPVVQLLRDDRQNDGLGSFNYAVEADNGIYLENSGSQGSQGQVNMQGGYRMQLEDGTFADVRYIADEFGTRVESPLLPTPPPLPAHVYDLLRIAEEQRAAGITFE
ncbi:hypothetical protein Pmani_023851 [Petrolisthes manimaculis]|uniref:Uncharacterized protein n=1 Tax=Petrolisthes manimaculis TaxID=1843537 RepID=A0AAE1TZW9_9EUCA|nr:hypothetical protein Pmani_023851 [Petrolisthes manimaculis]